MIEYSCKYWIGDEDCHRCELRGYFYGGCDYCEDYDSGNTRKEAKDGKSEEAPN